MARRSRTDSTGAIVSGDDWLYQAILRNSAIYDDTAPTVNADLMDDLVKMEREVSSRRSKREALHVRQRTDDLKTRLGYIKASQDFLAKLNDASTRASIATVQARVSRANNLTDARTRIATQRAQFNNALLNDARAAQPKGGIAAAAEKLQNTLNDQGAAYDVSKPEIANLGRQFFQMTLNESLENLTPDQVYKRFIDANTSPELASGMKQLFIESTQADEQVEGAGTEFDAATGTIKRLGAQAQLSAAEEQELLEAQRRAELSFQTLVGQTPEAITADLEKLAQADTEYKRLLSVEERLRKATFGEGAEGIRTRLGRVVANPDFQLWAKDNGYDNLGQASVDEKGNLSYIQGPDDERAMVRFAYQARTGKQSPWPFASKKTGEYVRVTITNDAARQRALDAARLSGDQYAVKDGALVDRDAFARQRAGFAAQGLMDPEVEFSDNGFIRMGGKVYKIEGDALVPAAAPENSNFAPGMFASEGRFVTSKDLEDIPAFKAKAADFGMAEPADVQAIQAKTGYQIVGADQIEGLGIQKFEGFRNKRNARTMGQLGAGAFSIGKDGDELEFAPGATYEVISTDRPKEKVTLGQRIRRAQDERERRRLDREAGSEDKLEAQAPERTAVSAPEPAAAPAAAPAPAAAVPAAPAAPAPAAPAPAELGEVVALPGGRTAARMTGSSMYEVRGADGKVQETVEPYFIRKELEAAASSAPVVAAPAAPAPAPVAAPVPAPSPAPAPAPVQKSYIRTGGGEVYSMSGSGETARLELVNPKPGQAPRVFTGSGAVDTELGALAGAGARPIPAEEARQYEKVQVRDMNIPPPSRKVTEEGSVPVTRIEDNVKIRPTLGEEVGGAIVAGAKKVGEGVSAVTDGIGGVFDRMKAKRAAEAAKKEGEERRARIEALPAPTDLPEAGEPTATGAAGAAAEKRVPVGDAAQRYGELRSRELQAGALLRSANEPKGGPTIAPYKPGGRLGAPAGSQDRALLQDIIARREGERARFDAVARGAESAPFTRSDREQLMRDTERAVMRSEEVTEQAAQAQARKAAGKQTSAKRDRQGMSLKELEAGETPATTAPSSALSTFRRFQMRPRSILELEPKR